MEIENLAKNVWITPEIRIDAPLDTEGDVVTCAAWDQKTGHVLVHFLANSGKDAYSYLGGLKDFYQSSLGLEAGYGKFGDMLFFSEPFPSGEYLFEWLERRERLSLSEAISLVIDQLRILRNAHSHGIVHGRLTPKSIMFVRENDELSLKLLGLGVARALPQHKRLDIDWSEYNFDLGGMSPESVDIYGFAIILMGMVSGEAGINSFEETGLLPQPLCEGLIQRTMEQALAMRIDSYRDVLKFQQDLEASMLELDGRKGEVFVGDLVGFESAVRSIAGIYEEESAFDEPSGVWNSVVENLEQGAKSDLLCSLTSLTAVRPVASDDIEDDDITRVSSVPKTVMNLRRIHVTHDDGEVDQHEEVTEVRRSEIQELVEAEPEPDHEVKPEPKREKPVIEGDDEDEVEDDAPTRVMTRPNYLTVKLADAEIAEEKVEEDDEKTKIEKMVKRINAEQVITHESVLGHLTSNDPNDPITFPYVEEPDPDPEPETASGLQADEASHADSQKTQKVKKSHNHSSKTNKHVRWFSNISMGSKIVFCVLIVLMIILVIVYLKLRG